MCGGGGGAADTTVYYVLGLLWMFGAWTPFLLNGGVRTYNTSPPAVWMNGQELVVGDFEYQQCYYTTVSRSTPASWDMTTMSTPPTVSDPSSTNVVPFKLPTSYYYYMATSDGYLWYTDQCEDWESAEQYTPWITAGARYDARLFSFTYGSTPYILYLGGRGPSGQCLADGWISGNIARWNYFPLSTTDALGPGCVARVEIFKQAIFLVGTNNVYTISCCTDTPTVSKRSAFTGSVRPLASILAVNVPGTSGSFQPPASMHTEGAGAWVSRRLGQDTRLGMADYLRFVAKRVKSSLLSSEDASAHNSSLLRSDHATRGALAAGIANAEGLGTAPNANVLFSAYGSTATTSNRIVFSTDGSTWMNLGQDALYPASSFGTLLSGPVDSVGPLIVFGGGTQDILRTQGFVGGYVAGPTAVPFSNTIPSRTPYPSPTRSTTPNPSQSPSFTATATYTPSFSGTRSTTPSETGSPPNTPSFTPTYSRTSSETASATRTASNTPSETATTSVTASATPAPSICPAGRYGLKCTFCPGYGGPSTPECSGHGECDGSGTALGTGTCTCYQGYMGSSCSVSKAGVTGGVIGGTIVAAAAAFIYFRYDKVSALFKSFQGRRLPSGYYSPRKGLQRRLREDDNDDDDDRDEGRKDIGAKVTDWPTSSTARAASAPQPYGNVPPSSAPTFDDPVNTGSRPSSLRYPNH